MTVYFIVLSLIVGLMVGYLVGKRQGFAKGYWAYDLWNVETLEDDLPEKTTRRNLAMKLQDEVADYVYVEDGKVKLKVVKTTEESGSETIIEHVELEPGVYDEAAPTVEAETSQE